MAKRRLITIGATLFALAFLVFTIWIIHEANRGQDNVLFQTVRATPHGDKIGHVLLAGTLTLVANFLFGHRCWRPGKVRLPYGSVAILALAMAEESSQYFLPTRSLDIMDALANLGGILLFSLPAMVWPRQPKVPEPLADD